MLNFLSKCHTTYKTYVTNESQSGAGSIAVPAQLDGFFVQAKTLFDTSPVDIRNATKPANALLPTWTELSAGDQTIVHELRVHLNKLARVMENCHGVMKLLLASSQACESYLKQSLYEEDSDDYC